MRFAPDFSFCSLLPGEAAHDRYRRVCQRRHCHHSRCSFSIRESSLLNSIAAVVSGSLDLKEIMGAALAKTSKAMDMEFGTAYCLECNSEPASNLGTRTPRTFSPDQLSLLAAVGQQVGVAVENARLYAVLSAIVDLE
jgi:hypothetical protein